MSTIYTYHLECPALGAVPAGDDEFLVYDTSTGRTKNVTMALMAAGPETITAGTTAAGHRWSGKDDPLPGLDGHPHCDARGRICAGLDDQPVWRDRLHGDWHLGHR
jgi:hypothetical protein